MGYAFYIYSAWGVAALVLSGVIAATLLDGRKLQADLKRLEAQGIRRRSAAGSDRS